MCAHASMSQADPDDVTRRRDVTTVWKNGTTS